MTLVKKERCCDSGGCPISVEEYRIERENQHVRSIHKTPDVKWGLACIAFSEAKYPFELTGYTTAGEQVITNNNVTANRIV